MGDDDTDEESHVVNKKDLRSSPISLSSSAEYRPLPLPSTIHTIIPNQRAGSVSNAASQISSTADSAISSASANIVILTAPSPNASTYSASSAITMMAQSNGRVVNGLIPVSKPPPGTRVIKIVNAGRKA